MISSCLKQQASLFRLSKPAYALGMASLGRFNFSSAEATEPHFTTEKNSDGVVIFNMNRPRSRNALSKQLVDEFQQAIADNNSSAKCVILRSSATGMFCAGADLKERKTM